MPRLLRDIATSVWLQMGGNFWKEMIKMKKEKLWQAPLTFDNPQVIKVFEILALSEIFKYLIYKFFYNLLFAKIIKHTMAKNNKWSQQNATFK